MPKYLYPLLAIVGFSLAVLSAKAGLNQGSDIDFYSLAIWGWTSAMLAATTCFYLPIKPQRQKLIPELKNNWRLFGVVSVLTIINGAAWFYGLSLVSGSIVALLDQNIFLWTFLFGVIFLGERFHWRELLGMGFVIVGLFVVSSIEGETTLFGVLALFVSGFSLALQSLLIKQHTFNALSLTFWRGWSMALGSFGIWFALGNFDFGITKEAWVFMFVGQLFGLFIARAAYIKSHEFFPISQLSFLLLFVPVLVLFGSYLLLGEPLSFKKLFGASVMILGLSWFLWEKERIKKTRG